MSTPRQGSGPLQEPSVRLALSYALGAGLWILGSDALLHWWQQEGWDAWMMDSLKGLLFVAVTAGLLFLFNRRQWRRQIRVEQALRDSEQRLALALEATDQGLYDLNLETGEAVVNAAYARMLGYEPATFHETDAAWRERLHPEDRAAALRHYEDYLAGRIGHYRVEFRVRTADGGWRWILSLGRVVERDAQGRPRRMLGTRTDITQRKLGEARIADALAFARAVIHSSPVGILTYGPDGKCETANASAARLLGGNVPDLLRQNFRTLESWQGSGLLAAAEQALQTGKERIFKGPLHTRFDRDLWVEARFVPFSYVGERHLLLLLDDVTDERNAQENLRLLHAALQAAPAGWVITDAAGIIEWANPAFTRLTGYAAAEAFGMKTSLLRSGRQPTEFYRQMWETVLRGEIWAGELCNRRKDGTLYEEHMTIVPVRDADGGIRHFVAMKTDITERKQLEQQLTRTQRLESIGMLASGIAHDLNNVLTPILLSIELLKAKYPASDGRKHLETVEAAAQRGAGIVRQVLTFARGIDGERAEVQPRYLLKDVGQLIEETFPRNIEVRYEAPRDVRPVRGDLTQLHQVILNLAVNARDAMPQGGVLTLSARDCTLDTPPPGTPLKPGAHVVLAVADTGSGITPEVLEHMFEPFYTTKPRGKGTGLGLSTVYGIVRSHGGAIQVKTKLGEGTTFEVVLPAASAENPPAETASAAPGLPGGGRKILVVDDEEGIRLITTLLLEKHGFVAVAAADGREGWQAFQADPPGFAAAIIDVVMPRMNGVALARQIHASAPAVPILLVTGQMGGETNPATGFDLPSAGVRQTLRKPYTEEELLRALAQVLGQTPSRQTGMTVSGGASGSGQEMG